MDFFEYPIGRWLILPHYDQDQFLEYFINFLVGFASHFKLEIAPFSITRILPSRMNIFLEKGYSSNDHLITFLTSRILRIKTRKPILSYPILTLLTYSTQDQ